jgi:hypothetical protein
VSRVALHDALLGNAEVMGFLSNSVILARVKVRRCSGVALP